MKHYAKPVLSRAESCCAAHAVDIIAGDTWCGAEIVLAGDPDPTRDGRIVGVEGVDVTPLVGFVECETCLERALHYHAIWTARAAGRLKVLR